MRGLMQRFRENTGGNVAIVFGLAAVPVFGAAGVAVDYTRASHFRSILQTAVDASALAGATQVSQAKITGTIDAYMKSTLPGGLKVNDVTYELDLQAGSVRVDAKATVPTMLASLFLD